MLREKDAHRGSGERDMGLAREIVSSTERRLTRAKPNRRTMARKTAPRATAQKAVRKEEPKC